MELFLWDLELFLQIQKRLGEHIVLKGGAALVRLMYEAILEGENWDSVKKALALEVLLELNQYDGKEKGNKIKEIRQMLVQEFASYSSIREKVLSLIE